MEGDTESLRKIAPNWSLAGDKQLLGMLQQIHQSIMTKCQEANAKLDAMVDALDNASIDLQNVNNKFMALSNSQFVESRVYDDDVDIKGEERSQKQETPQVEPESELQKIKRCLQKLEMMHDPVIIMGSDSSDDEESSMVLKLKDVYAHRPLPHIIGSYAWKAKWHAGLLPEDSDSDSSLSKRDNEPAEEYSDSEPEIAVEVTDTHPQRTISSSSVESEILSRSSQQVASPAAVAAELARRLAGPQLPVEPQTLSPPEPTTRKVYGMDKPTPATIFSNEPPPLDAYESDRYSDDDIFAELHKKSKPIGKDSKRSNFSANNIVDELFGDSSKNDIGNIVPDYMQPSSSVREDSPLFDEVLPTNSKKENPTNKPASSSTDHIKKPVGGISLFGSNKGAESIGAAILKRHQRKSTSDEESDVAEPQSQPIKEPVKDNKKMIEDLFTKPVVKKKDKDIGNKKIDNKTPVDKVDGKPKDNKIDLFSDNLFDDIDDIFTTNVTKPKTDKNTKSIFDDDDLFADVVEKTDKVKDKKDTKSIFDSDDDLFNDNDKTVTANENKTTNIQSNTNSEKISKTKEENNKVKSIFDDNSDDDLFSDFNVASQAENQVFKAENSNKSNIVKAIDTKTETSGNTSDNSLFSNKNNSNVTQNTITSNNKLINNLATTKQLQSPNLFDDDDDDDLFGINTEQKVQSLLKTSQNSKNKETTYSEQENNKINNKINENFTENKNDSNNSINALTKSENVEISKQNVSNDIKETIQTPIKQPPIPSTSSNQKLEENTMNNNKDKINPQENIEKKTDNIKEKDLKIAENNEVADELNKVTSTDDLTQEEPLFSEQNAPESKEPDIFSDIFNDLPPAFEKPSESKKSKNVNALFDDDSDDEALFFKKNEVINDEESDLEFSSDRFRIFHDEPPDIDVDFSQKPLKSANSNSSEEPIDDLFNEIPPIDNNKINEKEIISVQNKYKIDTIENEPVKTVDITKLLEDFSESETKQELNISKLLEDERPIYTVETNLKNESKVEQIIQNIEQNKTDEYETKEQQNSSEEDNTKKSIGKLKPMNFNINVSTLLPGASPKKSKSSEETDGHVVSTKSNDDINITSPNTETKIVKSVSFDGDPESEVLDNKLSKGRAKIQVKRRPSTRRARLEAVRKSGIDFGSDSTDNSSSFDEPKPKENIRNEVDSTIHDITSEKTIQDTDDKKPDIFSKIEQKQNRKKPEVKSKVVYILNDEDIFSDTSQNTIKNEKKDASDNNSTEINKTHKEEAIAKDKDRKVGTNDRKPLFDDLSDEELFGNKKPIQKAKESLFDSDSDAELFSKSKIKPVEQKEKARTSLFDESDDDDNLFASKTTKISDIKPTSKQIQPTNKATEPVFEDPLSMLGDDES